MSLNGDSMNKILLTFSILISFSFGQFGGQSFEKYLENASIMIGMNQSFYGSSWNDVTEDLEDGGADVDQNPFRKLSFTLMNQYKHGLLGGIKYLAYGFDYDFDIFFDDYYVGGFASSSKLELKFLKLFLTYPLNNGLYLGVEGGYFMEGESKIKIQNGANETNDIDRDMWTDSDFSEFDYGLLGQFYYNINENLLATLEGYYGLSKFSEDNDEEMTGIPNVFHYVNLGIAYKFGGKSK